MGVDLIIDLVGTAVSMVGVAIGYRQCHHARDESRHLRNLGDEKDQLSTAMMRVHRPALAVEATQILSGRQG